MASVNTLCKSVLNVKNTVIKNCVTVQNPSGSLIVIVQNRESKNLFYSDLLLLCG